MGQDPLSRRLRAVRRRPRPVSGHASSISASSSRRRSACTWSRATSRARSSTSRPISTCRPNSPARELPQGAGFAGLRIQEPRDGAARLAQERLGRLSRRRLFPRDRRTVAIRPLGARRRARRRRRRPAGGVPRLHRILHRLGAGRRHADALCADGGPLDRRRLPVPDDARQGRRHGHRAVALHPRARCRASASRR